MTDSAIWYLNMADVAAVARWMADHGHSASEVADLVEKPWKFTDQWDAMTAAAEDARSAPGWNGAGSNVDGIDMETNRG